MCCASNSVLLSMYRSRIRALAVLISAQLGWTLVTSDSAPGAVQVLLSLLWTVMAASLGVVRQGSAQCLPADSYDSRSFALGDLELWCQGGEKGSVE